MSMVSPVYGWAAVRLDEQDLVELLRRNGYEVRKAADPACALQERLGFAERLAILAHKVGRGLCEPKARLEYESLCRRYWQPADGFSDWWRGLQDSCGFNPVGIEGL